MDRAATRVDGLAVAAAVFLSGAVLLGVEIAASRVLAPTFGSSLYVWGALIGVVLTGLAVGYWLGGTLADRWPSPYLFVGAIALGAALVLAIPLVDTWVLEQVVAWDPGPRLDPLVAAILLFGPMSVALASVSPIAVRLAARDIERLGRTAGRLFAISTAGSIAGTFATSFWLVPEYGTDQVLAVGAVVLLVAAAVVALLERLWLPGVGLVAAAGAAVLAVGALAPDTDRRDARRLGGPELVAALPRARGADAAQARPGGGRHRRRGIHRPGRAGHAVPPPARGRGRRLALPAFRQLLPEWHVPAQPVRDAILVQRLPPARARLQPERTEHPRRRARGSRGAEAALAGLPRRHRDDRRARPGRRRRGVPLVPPAPRREAAPRRGRRRPSVPPADRRSAST